MTQPSLWWEFPVVQLTNFVVFVITLICFEFFWRQLTVRYYRTEGASESAPRLPRPVWLLVGYSLFIWSSLNLIEIWAVTPDMMVAAFVYLAAGLLLQSAWRDASRFTLPRLGLVLGLGYYAKAALFPLGIVCLLFAAAAKGNPRKPAVRLALAALPFAIVVLPLVLTFSIRAGHVTFADVGRFTYLKHVNQLLYPHWDESLERVNGTAEHPPRRVFENPDVYEFAYPIGGTYPLMFDPGYWTAGLSPRVNVRQQLLAVASNVRFYFDLFLRTQGGFVALLLVLGIVALRAGIRPTDFSAESALVVWALCAFGLYATVFVTARYIAPFVVIFWAGILASLSLPDGVPYRRVLTASGVILALLVWVNIATVNLEAATALLGYSVDLPADAKPADNSRLVDRPSASHPAIAEGLQRLGIREGDRIGFIGYSFTAFWARLARVRIIVEIAPEHAGAFWNAGDDTQAKVLQVFANAGAKALVSEPTERPTLIPPGWQRVGQTGYLVRLFQ